MSKERNDQLELFDDNGEPIEKKRKKPKEWRRVPRGERAGDDGKIPF